MRWMNLSFRGRFDYTKPTASGDRMRNPPQAVGHPTLINSNSPTAPLKRVGYQIVDSPNPYIRRYYVLESFVCQPDRSIYHLHDSHVRTGMSKLQSPDVSGQGFDLRVLCVPRFEREVIMKTLLTVLCLIFCLTPIIAFAQVTADDLSWDFESGSMGSATTASSNNINLTLRLDDQQGDTYGWYYFKINQNAMGQAVTFRILNRDGWMTEEDKPVCSYDGQTWFRASECWLSSDNLYFRHQFQADSVWIAQDFPFTYSDMIALLDTLALSPYFDYEFIGQTVHGRDIPLATISDPGIPEDEKRCVWIISRQHPMETPPTYTLEAMMKNLIGLGEPGGEELLEKLDFKIIPMVNIDGIVEGLSRHNVHGINLNRIWGSDSNYTGEEPEVAAVHNAIDDWIYGGHRIDFFSDMHAAPDPYDFGFRLSQSYSYPAYYQDLTTYLKHLQINDPYQNWQRWRDLDENYALGVVGEALFDQHGLVSTSSEHSWVMRYNGAYNTIESLLSEGRMYEDSFDDYLFPIEFTDELGNDIEWIFENNIYVTATDFDENENSGVVESVTVVIQTEDNGDIEQLTLTETWQSSGIFRNLQGLPPEFAEVVPNNGILEVANDERVFATYVDDDFPLDSSWTFVYAVHSDNVGPEDVPIKNRLNLSNHPDPFNNVTAIGFTIPYPAEVKLTIFDIAGRNVFSIGEKYYAAGPQSIKWDASEIPSGIYFCRLRAGSQASVEKMILVK